VFYSELLAHALCTFESTTYIFPAMEDSTCTLSFMSFSLEIERVHKRANGNPLSSHFQKETYEEVTSMIEDLSHKMVTMTRMVNDLGSDKDTIDIREQL
jgi:hypothetical protein